MSTKIQINSLEALERLIGNDNELEIQIRNSIVNEFVKKHLKSLANVEAIELAKKSVEEYIKKEFFEVVGTGWSTKLQFQPKALEKLNEFLNTKVSGQLYAIIDNIVGAKTARETLQKSIETAAETITDRLTDAILTRRIDELVDKKIKERLNLK